MLRRPAFSLPGVGGLPSYAQSFDGIGENNFHRRLILDPPARRDHKKLGLA
jgi:hypothetical protein